MKTKPQTQLYRVIYARQVWFFRQGVSVLESNTTNTAELLRKHGNTLNISRPQILRKWPASTNSAGKHWDARGNPLQRATRWTGWICCSWLTTAFCCGKCWFCCPTSISCPNMLHKPVCHLPFSWLGLRRFIATAEKSTTLHVVSRDNVIPM